MPTATKNKKTKTMPVTVGITYFEIANLLCSALEGGSNYWYYIQEVIEPKKKDRYDFEEPNGIFSDSPYYYSPLSKGGALIIEDMESREKDEDNEDATYSPGKMYRLDLENISKGLGIMATKYPGHFGDFLNEEADATTGDVFLQCCLFGAVVYG